MKKCCRCHQNKNLTEFVKNKTKRDGLSNICKQCNNEYTKLYYRNNIETLGPKMQAQTKKYHQRLRDRLDKYKADNGGCCNCKEQDPCCLDFHHLNKDEKEYNVADL